MSVKIIRPHGHVDYSVELRKVRIEFKDGSHLFGYINIHSKYASNDQEEGNLEGGLRDSNFKFRRTSDYLKDCNQNDGMLIVFNATYGGHADQTIFVFLHSVKFIMELQETKVKTVEPEKPELEEENGQPEKTGLSLRERLKRE